MLDWKFLEISLWIPETLNEKFKKVTATVGRKSLQRAWGEGGSIGLMPQIGSKLSDFPPKNPVGWVICRGWHSYPLMWGLFHKPLWGSLLTNQDSMESRKVFFVAQVILQTTQWRSPNWVDDSSDNQEPESDTHEHSLFVHVMKKSIWVFFLLGQYGIQKNINSFHVPDLSSQVFFSVWFHLKRLRSRHRSLRTPWAMMLWSWVVRSQWGETDGSRGGGFAGWGGCWGSSSKRVGGEWKLANQRKDSQQKRNCALTCDFVSESHHTEKQIGFGFWEYRN